MWQHHSCFALTVVTARDCALGAPWLLGSSLYKVGSFHLCASWEPFQSHVNREASTYCTCRRHQPATKPQGVVSSLNPAPDEPSKLRRQRSESVTQREREEPSCSSVTFIQKHYLINVFYMYYSPKQLILHTYKEACLLKSVRFVSSILVPFFAMAARHLNTNFNIQLQSLKQPRFSV